MGVCVEVEIINVRDTAADVQVLVSREAEVLNMTTKARDKTEEDRVPVSETIHHPPQDQKNEFQLI